MPHINITPKKELSDSVKTTGWCVCPLVDRCDGAQYRNYFVNLCSDGFSGCSAYVKGQPIKFDNARWYEVELNHRA